MASLHVLIVWSLLSHLLSSEVVSNHGLIVKDHIYLYFTHTSDKEINFGRIGLKMSPPPRLSGEEKKMHADQFPHVTFGFEDEKINSPGFGNDHSWNQISIFGELLY